MFLSIGELLRVSRRRLGVRLSSPTVITQPFASGEYVLKEGAAMQVGSAITSAITSAIASAAQTVCARVCSAGVNRERARRPRVA